MSYSTENCDWQDVAYQGKAWILTHSHQQCSFFDIFIFNVLGSCYVPFRQVGGNLRFFCTFLVSFCLYCWSLSLIIVHGMNSVFCSWQFPRLIITYWLTKFILLFHTFVAIILHNKDCFLIQNNFIKMFQLKPYAYQDISVLRFLNALTVKILYWRANINRETLVI